MVQKFDSTEGPARAIFLSFKEKWSKMNFEKMDLVSENKRNKFNPEDGYQKSLKDRVCDLLFELIADKQSKAFPRRDYGKFADLVLVRSM